MARLFALLVLLFLGGTGIASLVTGNFWPLICAAGALVILAKVFAAADKPNLPPGQRPPVIGASGWRYPS